MNRFTWKIVVNSIIIVQCFARNHTKMCASILRLIKVIIITTTIIFTSTSTTTTIPFVLERLFQSKLSCNSAYFQVVAGLLRKGTGNFFSKWNWHYDHRYNHPHDKNNAYAYNKALNCETLLATNHNIRAIPIIQCRPNFGENIFNRFSVKNHWNFQLVIMVYSYK